MATAVRKITLSASRDIPFNRLVLSQSNVRRVKAGVSIEELAEDIARRSLLQSLNVRLHQAPRRLCRGRHYAGAAHGLCVEARAGSAIGLTSEIISWKLRLFVPIGASGPDILARVVERHPLVRIADGAAA